MLAHNDTRNFTDEIYDETVTAFFVASLLVLFFNVGIPNELKGCLFFIQVSNNYCSVFTDATTFSLLIVKGCGICL